MKNTLTFYNTIKRKKEAFQPLNPPFVGMYLCGPTVYSDAHLGHSRGAITFDILFRYFKHLGYQVRYVRNITDVGHLVDEVAGEGEDRIAKKARQQRKEPMEVVQHYKNGYHRNMDALNVLRPSIEPTATGHIMEQIETIEQILANGYAYESNGSVYFDVLKYNFEHNYGKLSGRKIEELLQNSRENLEGQDEKRNPMDFALWKKAAPEHIMRWKSPWSDGFPGWHLECSVMSTKYLGEQFDIHGGGLDLLFPHHECEIAQSVGTTGKEAVQYWLHNNMITIDGQKMARSLGNFITLDELFSGEHERLEQAYSPMTMRFFILQAHYRGTQDFSNPALKAAEKGYKRFMQGIKTINELKANGETSDFSVDELIDKSYAAINDDLNTPICLAELFEGIHQANLIKEDKVKINQKDLEKLQKHYQTFAFEILGLIDESETASDSTQDLMALILDIRKDARANKDFQTSDKIRDGLDKLGFEIKDDKAGATWNRK